MVPGWLGCLLWDHLLQVEILDILIQYLKTESEKILGQGQDDNTACSSAMAVSYEGLCCVIFFLKERKWQRHSRQPELWLLLFDRQARKLLSTSLWRERLGRKVQRKCWSKKNIYIYTHQWKEKPRLLWKEMSDTTWNTFVHYRVRIIIYCQMVNIPRLRFENICSHLCYCTIKKSAFITRKT